MGSLSFASFLTWKSQKNVRGRPIRYSTYSAAPFWPSSGWGTGQRCRLDVTGSNVVNPQFRRQPTPLYCRQLTGCRHCPLIGESSTSCKRLNVSHHHHHHHHNNNNNNNNQQMLNNILVVNVEVVLRNQIFVQEKLKTMQEFHHKLEFSVSV